MRPVRNAVARIHRIVFKTAKLPVLLVGFTPFLLPRAERIVTEDEQAELVPYGGRVQPLAVQGFFFGIHRHLAAKIPVKPLPVGMIRIFQVADGLGQNSVAGNQPHHRLHIVDGQRVENGLHAGAGQKGFAASRRHLKTHVRHMGQHVFVRLHLFPDAYLHALIRPQQLVGLHIIMVSVQVRKILFQILQRLCLIGFQFHDRRSLQPFDIPGNLLKGNMMLR